MPRHGGSGVVKEKDKDKDGTKEKVQSKEKYKEKSDRKAHADSERSGPSTARRMSDTERKHSVRPTDELKLLQDSLSQFFTPSAGRRCRQPPRKFDESGVNSDDSVHHHNDSGCEKTEPPTGKIPRRKKSSTECSMMNLIHACTSQRCFFNLSRSLTKLNNMRFTIGPFSREEGLKPLTVDVESKTECPGSSSSTRSVTSDPSPSRRMCEKLVDSLSPYFSTSSEKRRTTQKGEFAQLHSGRTRNVKKDKTVNAEQYSYERKTFVDVVAHSRDQCRGLSVICDVEVAYSDDPEVLRI
ncbi:unnamed protein product [Haemonchus placei]|uniref:SWT1 RNA endoribonuclease homolog n=1 Tax=Haemonchus placei TaxID=6290 RepID=A0A0N4WII6_HAEPC|nr:unnamed protein product [Haemonchus placei]